MAGHRIRVNCCTLGGVGLTTDIAGMCAFLRPGEAAYSTGQTLDVSGGEGMH